jgi:hypothetical protein
LEEEFFEQKELADPYNNDEAIRLGRIWQAERDRLYQESLSKEIQTGSYLTP